MRRFLVLLAALALASPAGAAVWISSAEIASLPNSGTAYTSMLSAAGGAGNTFPGYPNVSYQDDQTDTKLLAKALVYVRTGTTVYRDSCRVGLMRAIDTDIGVEPSPPDLNGNRTLALGRNLTSIVIAADLVGLAASDTSAFNIWLRACLTRTYESGIHATLVTTHEQDPNNWGTHAGAARAAVCVYLGLTTQLSRCNTVFLGWTGDLTVSTYSLWDWDNDLSWQSTPSTPRAINPVNGQIGGANVDGGMPEELRRGCSFSWPPYGCTGTTCTNTPTSNADGIDYTWEALQGAVVQAEILKRAGFSTVYTSQSSALKRAMQFLERMQQSCNQGTTPWWPAAGDDRNTPWIINKAYGLNFPTSSTSMAKNIGFADWTHAPSTCPGGVSTSRYVRSDGNNSNAGTTNSAAGAYKNIGMCNQNLVAGDTCYIISTLASDTTNTTVNTTNSIRPTRNGTRYADPTCELTPSQGPIVYYGVPSAPSSRVVRNVYLEYNYCIVKGVRGVSIDNVNENEIKWGSATKLAQHNVIDSCIIDDAFGIKGGKYNKVAHCTMNLTGNVGNNNGGPFNLDSDDNITVMSAWDTVRSNTVNLGQAQGSNMRVFNVRGFAHDCLVDSNTFTCDFNDAGRTQPADETYGFTLRWAYNNTFMDNSWTWEISTAHPSGEDAWQPLCLRSGSFGNKFIRERHNIDPTSPYFGNRPTFGQHSMPVCSICPPSGSEEAAAYNCIPTCVNGQTGDNTRQVHSNTWIGGTYTNPSGHFQFQVSTDDYKIKNCTFIGRDDPAVTFIDGGSATIVDHNTFFSRTPTVVKFENDGGSPPFSSFQFTNNIILGDSLYQCATMNGEGEDGDDGPLVGFELVPSNGNGFVMNNNLYFSRTGLSTRDASRYAVGAGSSSCWNLPDSTWCFPMGFDCNSQWANPQLRDTSLAGFSERLWASSPAIGTRWGRHPDSTNCIATDIEGVQTVMAGGCDGNTRNDFYCGASPPPDSLPPGTITFTATCSGVDLYKSINWTTPGDDSTFFQAESIFIAEKSDNPADSDITPANFATHQIYAARAGEPGSGGNYDCQGGTLGCGSDVLYAGYADLVGYYRMRIKDKSGNYGYSKTIAVTCP